MASHKFQALWHLTNIVRESADSQHHQTKPVFPRRRSHSLLVLRRASRCVCYLVTRDLRPIKALCFNFSLQRIHLSLFSWWSERHRVQHISQLILRSNNPFSLYLSTTITNLDQHLLRPPTSTITNLDQHLLRPPHPSFLSQEQHSTPSQVAWLC